MRYILFISFWITIHTTAFSQTVVKGIVTDGTTGEGLIGVNIGFDDQGTTSDYDGSYSLELDNGSYEISYSYLGYKTEKRQININGEKEISLDIQMSEESEMLVITTVTSSRYERNITKEAVSIEVIKPEFIERNANTDLAQVIERVPGVQVVDGQANIRSGSGFAYGAGSRVAVVVDEQPLLSAELSDVKWNFIPIENASQIEIIKGAASVLYGSGGLNGVINVRSAYPTSEPYTKLTTYAGVYNISNKNGRRWYNRDSTGMRPFFSGLYFAHRQKIKENFDLVIGSNIHYDRNFLRTTDEQRYRFNVNTRYRLPKNEKISIGINANFMRHVRGDFFIWENGDVNAYEHITGDVDEFKYYTLNLDPYITAFDAQENKHSLKLRYFTIGKRTSNGNSPTGVLSSEYQFQKNFKEKDLVLTTGLSYQHFYAKSNLFQDSIAIVGNDTITTFSTERINIASAYIQVDKGFFDNRLNVTLGGRVENYSISNDASSTIPVFRGGINYSLTPKDFLRASYGQGYRVPSLAERYLDDQLTDEISVIPNPNLKAEFGSSVEIGYKRAFGGKNDNWKGFVDAAIFWMDYDDMTEFRFGLYFPDSLIAGGLTYSDSIIAIINNDYLGFRATNVNRARIAGFEVSAFGEGKLWGMPTRFWTGYTYSYPGDLTEDPSQKKFGTYMKNFFRGIALKHDDPLVNSILNFRALHVARFDMEMDIQRFTIGMAANYNGYMYDVDDFFKGEGAVEEIVAFYSEDVKNIVESLAAFRSNRTKGDWVIDLRTSYRFKNEDKLDFIINNINNRQYALRPLKMSAPMTINFRYSRKF